MTILIAYVNPQDALPRNCVLLPHSLELRLGEGKKSHCNFTCMQLCVISFTSYELEYFTCKLVGAWQVFNGPTTTAMIYSSKKNTTMFYYTLSSFKSFLIQLIQLMSFESSAFIPSLTKILSLIYLSSKQFTKVAYRLVGFKMVLSILTCNWQEECKYFYLSAKPTLLQRSSWQGSPLLSLVFYLSFPFH